MPLSGLDLELLGSHFFLKVCIGFDMSVAPVESA